MQLKEVYVIGVFVVLLLAVTISKWSWASTATIPHITSALGISEYHHRQQRLRPNQTYPTYHRIRAPNRVVSIPDIHGDYDGLVEVLKLAKLISNETDWVGKDAVLVQTGDILDRGDYSGDALRLFAKLQSQAEKVGGKVVVLMGNHELMNLMEYFIYATPGEDRGFLPDSRTKAFRKYSGEFGTFVRSFPAAVVVSMSDSADSSILFVHGGLAPEAIGKRVGNDDPIATLNTQLGKLVSMDARAIKAEYGVNELVSENGPLWNRFFAMGRDESKVCSKLQETLGLVGAGKMVVGHTVQVRSSVGSRCGGRIVLSDVSGFSPLVLTR